jgi:hypothetical protein
MSKQAYKVVEVTVQPGPLGEPETKETAVKGPLSHGMALAWQEKLENKLPDFDPNKIVSYLVKPAN